MIEKFSDYMPLPPPPPPVTQSIIPRQVPHVAIFSTPPFKVMLVSLLNAKNSKCKTSFFNTQWKKKTQFQDKCLNNVDQK